MRTVVIFGSVTRTGNTFLAASKLAGVLGGADLRHADDLRDPAFFRGYDAFVFLTPTAGNEELAEPFERLFDLDGIDFAGARYAVCELGNYYGYDLYEYGAVIGYTTAPVVPGRGSAIFLHVWGGAGRPTAGCVAVAKAELVEILRWLDRAKNPAVVIRVGR